MFEGKDKKVVHEKWLCESTGPIVIVFILLLFDTSVSGDQTGLVSFLFMKAHRDQYVH